MGNNKENLDQPNSSPPFEHNKMKRCEYEREKAKLQVELLKMQKWVSDAGVRLIVLFEGRDAAGKGGSIKRFTEHLNPRAARVAALNKPTYVERQQWYFQRYVQHFPTGGEIVFFDRSWYNRAGVEKVMGFCTDEDYELFMKTVSDLEKIWINSGILLFKYWFSVSKGEQKRRFASREVDPLKQWKLSDIDREGQGMWSHYTKAKEQMFLRTSTDHAPWTVVKSDDKKRARINCMKDLLVKLPYENKNKELIEDVDLLVVSAASKQFG